MLLRWCFDQNWMVFSYLKNNKQKNGNDGTLDNVVLFYLLLALAGVLLNTAIHSSKRCTVTGLIGPLKCKRQKVQPVTFQVLPPSFQMLPMDSLQERYVK